MQIKQEYPPNYIEILAHIPKVADSTTVTFCYGDTIYNPHKLNLTEDLILHEGVHTKQQGLSPEAWWYKYLRDDIFRLEQELEAYGEQYLFIKSKTTGKLREWILDKMSEALSGELYGGLLNFAEAKSKIRNYEQV
jgi:hypothetical protein